MSKDLFENSAPEAEGQVTEPANGNAEAAAEQPQEESPKKNSRKAKAKEPAEKPAEQSAPASDRDLSLMEVIHRIGLELKCPKSNIQKDANTGRQFPYRCVEDILTALAPFREKYGVFLTFSSRPVLVGTFNYIVVEATIHNLKGEYFTTSSSAREDAFRPGYWGAQVSGSCESYAKKYALQSMFMIDEGKFGAVVDTDAVPASKPAAKPSPKEAPAKTEPQAQSPAQAPEAAAETQSQNESEAETEAARERKPLSRDAGDWMARMSDAAMWHGTKKEFIDKILDNYLITKSDMMLLVAAIPAQ